MKVLLIVFQIVQQFLLMKPIEYSFMKNDFSNFNEICETYISSAMDYPLLVKGFLKKEEFIKNISQKMKYYKVIKIEWGSKQIEGKYAVQSINLELIDLRDNKTLYYKIIFFMKKNIKWKLYYLVGIEI